MITESLYETILLNPASIDSELNELFIISGYASATFLRRHLNDLHNSGVNSKINLLIGMPSRVVDHQAYLRLINEYDGRFQGHYYQGPVPVHSKAYAWFRDDIPDLTFTGSANYSQYGFFSRKQINQMNFDEGIEVKRFYDELLQNSIAMEDAHMERPEVEYVIHLEGSVAPGTIEWIDELTVRISFLDKRGVLPAKSGLNWGQRTAMSKKADGTISYTQRNPDQAYLSLKQEARDEGFLPEKAFSFSLITDDDKSFDCVVAQMGRKAIETTNDNSELGRYIRDRLGVSHGTFLTSDHLTEYGRTDYTLKKIDDETIFFDFSV